MHPTGQTAHRGEGQKMRAPPSASTPTKASERQVTMLSLPVMLTPSPRPERCPSGNPGPCPDFPTLYRDTAAWWGANPSSSLAPRTWFWFCFLRPSKAGGAGSIPGQGAKSTHALRFKIRKKKKSKYKTERVSSLGGEEPLEKGMATHSSILARRIPWTLSTVHGIAKSWT